MRNAGDGIPYKNTPLILNKYRNDLKILSCTERRPRRSAVFRII
jgi:hypothetical protein